MHAWLKAFPAGICVTTLAALTAPSASAAFQAEAELRAAADSASLHVLGAPAVERATTLAPALGKLDNSLLRLSRAYQLAQASGAPATADLRLQNPRARLRYSDPLAAPAVLVDVFVSGDPQAARAQLEQLGFKTSAVFGNDIGGWLPLDQAAQAAALSNLRLVRTAMMHTRATPPADPVAYQGDFAQGSLALKQATGLNGSGVTVGIISDSFNCNGAFDAANPTATHRGDYADDVALGALPAGVTVIKEDPANANAAFPACPGTDEGRALAQIVYAVAPGAKLAFYTADGSEADFAQGIQTLALSTAKKDPNGLAGGGAQIIDDDVGYFDEPVYQEGEVGVAIDTVVQQGVLYFSSAGNEGRNSYENDQPSFSGSGAAKAPNAGEQLLNIDTSGKTKTYYLPITIPALANNDGYNISLFWDQPYQSSTGANDPGDVNGNPGIANGPGAASVLDICIGDANGNISSTGTIGGDGIYNGPLSTVTSCAGASNLAPNPASNGATSQPGDKDPYNLIQVFNTSGATTPAVQASLVIGLISGPAPHRVKVIVQDDGRGTTINQFATNSSTIQGHPLSPNAMTVGAAFYDQTPACDGKPQATLESFSSAGGSTMLFDPNGAALTPQYVPRKPDITAPDGITTSFFGFAVNPISTSTTQCQLSTKYPFNFFGTSAAAPHAAGVAALLLQAHPGATPEQVYSALRISAQHMDTAVTGFSYDSGYGLVQAQAAKTALDNNLTPQSASGGGGGGAFAPMLLLPGLLLAGLRRRKR
jgi:hypothetical protein